jgi:hypothetical protein
MISKDYICYPIFSQSRALSLLLHKAHEKFSTQTKHAATGSGMHARAHDAGVNTAMRVLPRASHTRVTHLCWYAGPSLGTRTWHGVMWLGGEDQDKTWLDGPVARWRVSQRLSAGPCCGMLEQKTWHIWTNGEDQVKSRSMNQHIAWWYEVDHIVCDGVDECFASTLEKMEWYAQGKGISNRNFISLVIGV